MEEKNLVITKTEPCKGCKSNTRIDILDENEGYCDWCDDANKDVNKGYTVAHPPATVEEADEPKCTLTNEELVERTNAIVRKLCDTGGKSWSLRVPVDFNRDPDILIIEIGKRLLKACQSKPMTSERIKEIQKTTTYPDSVSVYQALLQVWNECEQSKPEPIKSLKEISDIHKANIAKSEPMERKSLRECKDEICKRLGYTDWQDMSYYNGLKDIEKFSDELAELYASQSQPQWRECAKELPDLHERVLVTEWTKRLSEPSILTASLELNRWRLYGGYTAEKITHWQPLPSPPLT